MSHYKKYLIVGGVLIVIILTFLSYTFFDFEEYEYIADEVKTTEEVVENFYVDVKGAVKNPGVYQFKSGDRVFQAIEIAGGLTKNGSTSNINLSQKLTGEMVVYVYTNAEIKNGAKSISCETKCQCESIEVNNCYQQEESINNDKVNINTANLDTLLTLSGIGEAKAKTIINYRSENGDFKQIEDLINVSGIGQTLFDKIKDHITI